MWASTQRLMGKQFQVFKPRNRQVPQGRLAARAYARKPKGTYVPAGV